MANEWDVPNKENERIILNFLHFTNLYYLSNEKKLCFLKINVCSDQRQAHDRLVSKLDNKSVYIFGFN